MKRICMVRNSYYPWMQPNRRNAATLVEHGFEVDVICLKLKGQPSRETIGGVRIFRLPIEHRRGGLARYLFEYGSFFLLVFWRLAWASLLRRYQAIEVSGMPDILVFTTLVPRLLGVPVVLNLYDHTPEILMIRFKIKPDHFIIKLLHKIEGLSARYANHCLATQEFNRQVLQKHGVPDSGISIFYNVPEDTWSQHYKAGEKKDDRFVLLTHGSLLEYYGVQTLIRAAPLLVNEIPNLKVKVVGDGDYRQRLEELTRELGIEHVVQFSGMMLPCEIPECIGESDIGIVTIEALENPMLPNKLFEYLHMSKPAISSAIPAITAYFDHQAVMFYEPGNEQDLARCIRELHRDPHRRALLAENGAAVYNTKYRWDLQKPKYVDVYSRLMDGKKISSGIHEALSQGGDILTEEGLDLPGRLGHDPNDN